MYVHMYTHTVPMILIVVIVPLGLQVTYMLFPLYIHVLSFLCVAMTFFYKKENRL